MVERTSLRFVLSEVIAVLRFFVCRFVVSNSATNNVPSVLIVRLMSPSENSLSTAMVCATTLACSSLTPNPKPQTPNPKPQTPNLQINMLNCMLDSTHPLLPRPPSPPRISFFPFTRQNCFHNSISTRSTLNVPRKIISPSHPSQEPHSPTSNQSAPNPTNPHPAQKF